MELIKVDELVLLQQRLRRRWFHYGMEEKVLVDNVSFSVERHRSLAIVGEENSGKLPLTLAMLRLHEISSGKIEFREVDIHSVSERRFRMLRRGMQAVFPDSFGQLTRDLTVNQSFLEVLRLWYRRESKDDWFNRIEKVMVACGLPEALRHLYPLELDAVERQQVALARALLSSPDLLICHGLTQGLDAVEQAELLNRVMKIREDFALTILIVTDDLAVGHHLGDDIAVLHRGRILEFGDSESVVNRPQHDYTQRLVSCSV